MKNHIAGSSTEGNVIKEQNVSSCINSSQAQETLIARCASISARVKSVPLEIRVSTHVTRTRIEKQTTVNRMGQKMRVNLEVSIEMLLNNLVETMHLKAGTGVESG